MQVTIRTADNIPENFVTNQFATTDNISTPSDADLWRDAVNTFYDDVSGALFPSTIAQNGHIVKMYAAGGPTPNYPYYESTFDLSSAPSGGTLPSEVALCLSFQGVRTAGNPQARRRGRIYLGPLDTGVNSSGRPSTTDITTILDAAEAFYDDVALITTAGVWAVWSPTDGQAVPLTEAWVDDAFDTQRSRGLGRTTRTVRDLT